MPANNDLRELRVAVTGGTSGLGLALVRRLVARGARVAFVARNARAVEQIADETGAHGIVGDVGRKEDIHPIALQVLGNLGGLEALVNNASALGPTPLALLADTVEQITHHGRITSAKPTIHRWPLRRERHGMRRAHRPPWPRQSGKERR